MIILKNYPLKKHNTFGIDCNAENLVRIRSETDLKEAIKLPYPPVYVLGGGSNILLTGDLSGLVLKNEIKGIKVIEEDHQEVIIQAGGGENWHQLVCWSIKRNYGGIENLSLIPGTVGAAPIQNIGAYGVELREVFEKLEAINLRTGKKKIFYSTDCAFAYRDSIFKNTLKNEYCITQVCIRLTKTNHRLITGYGAIREVLQEKHIKDPTIQDISDAVISIRSGKLPNPEELGNSGSFFKNPEIDNEQFEQLQKKFPQIVHYELPDNKVKIPAGWLIEQCGWKGKRIGNTGAHASQALVLVNYGGASGKEVKKLADQIRSSVLNKFGIELSCEVNII